MILIISVVNISLFVKFLCWPVIIWCSVNFLHSDCCCAFLVDPGGTTFTLAHSSETCMCLELASGPAAFTFWQMEQPSFLFWQISHEYNFFFLSLKICVVQHSGKSSKISMSLSPCSLLSSPERLVSSKQSKPAATSCTSLNSTKATKLKIHSIINKFVYCRVSSVGYTLLKCKLVLKIISNHCLLDCTLG